jgi:branched-chain amino acid transport system ATP-binding protein
MSRPLLEVNDVSKRFGGFAALSEVSFSLADGERLGIIGPNGSGKTTLMNCISGALACDHGAIAFDGAEITRLAVYRRARLGIARSFQVPRPFVSLSVLENICVPLEYTSSSLLPSGELLSTRALALLAQVRLTHKAEVLAGNLTQVELRKLELARALATQPRLLILDEVMAGLSTTEVDEILDIAMQINARGVAVIMIEHIMRAIMRFSHRVLCLDAGKIIAQGSPQETVDNAAVRRIYLGA